MSEHRPMTEEDLKAAEHELDQPWAEYLPGIHALGHKLIDQVRRLREALDRTTAYAVIGQIVREDERDACAKIAKAVRESYGSSSDPAWNAADMIHRDICARGDDRKAPSTTD